jgi:hypothetical protein
MVNVPEMSPVAVCSTTVVSAKLVSVSVIAIDGIFNNTSITAIDHAFFIIHYLVNGSDEDGLFLAKVL